MPGDAIRAIVDRAALDALPRLLRERGYTVIGPTLREAAIVYDEIESLAELPVGWTDEQSPGSYRLRRREDAALFGYNVGPHSWKGRLHPADVLLFRARRRSEEMEIEPGPLEAPKLALIGVRACEIAAIAVQDRVLLGSGPVDPIYQARRRDNLVIAVNCTQAGATCFCSSMKTGPAVTQGFDLALTELVLPDGHRFLVEVGSDAGREVLGGLESRDPPAADVEAARGAVARAEAQMGRTLDTDGIQDLLARTLESPVWDEVAARCLGCANCTMVCPTCFCTTVEDVTDLSGDHAERWRRWDSCYTLSFSQVGGGIVRASTASRYRQWLTHKLGTWHDQFGSSGCVGCGRCITWCPVGIDLTEEIARLRARETGHGAEDEP